MSKRHDSRVDAMLGDAQKCAIILHLSGVNAQALFYSLLLPSRNYDDLDATVQNVIATIRSKMRPRASYLLAQVQANIEGLTPTDIANDMLLTIDGLELINIAYNESRSRSTLITVREIVLAFFEQRTVLTDLCYRDLWQASSHDALKGMLAL